MAKTTETSVDILLPDTRLSFPHLWTPKAFQPGQTPRFEATGLMDPTNPVHVPVIAKIKSEAERIVKLQFKGQIPPGLKRCFGLSDKQDPPKTYDGYPGMFFISTNNKNRVPIVGKNRQPVVEGDTEAPFAGCYVNMLISLWVQDNQWGKRVNANLKAVQFRRKGDAFGVRPVDTDEVFEAYGDEDEGGGSQKASSAWDEE